MSVNTTNQLKPVPAVFQATGVIKVYSMGDVEVQALRGVDLEPRFSTRTLLRASKMPNLRDGEQVIVHPGDQIKDAVCAVAR